MKDILISSKHIKREFIVILVCFILAIMINIGAIIAYNRPWSEVYSQIGYVVVVGIIIYAITIAFRIIAHLIMILFKKKK